MAQPNLSKGIKELESSWDQDFQAHLKGRVTHRKGAKFLSYAKKIIVQIEKMEALQYPDEPGKTGL
jgi:DNA-binding transcriptional LysR family regulator